MRNAIQALDSVSKYDHTLDDVEDTDLEQDLVSFLLQASGLENDKYILKILTGLYSSDAKAVVGTILDVRGKQTDYNQLTSRLLEANDYLISVNTVDKHSAAWSSRLHITCNNAVKEIGFDLEKAVLNHNYINIIINELRSDYNVDRFHLLLRHFAKLF